MNYGTVEERVARGAAELDKVKPEWPTLMKLETFTKLHDNPDNACVADRVFGHWSKAPRPFFDGGYTKYGMNIWWLGSDEERAAEDAALVAAWKKETIKRLELLNG
jgi:hypothetical protein